MNINWEDLIKSYNGFEDLANEYIRYRWKDIDWKPTKKTRDGNRDGEAFVYVFQGNKKVEAHWWMEAKYSINKTRLSRYRMDPTIVSALIDGKVKKVVFISNTDISAKDMNDIRIALRNGIQCHEVTFCTRLELEYWISKNPQIYRMYFKQTIPFEQISVPKLYVTEGLTFYNASGKYAFFKEPLQKIFPGHNYSVFFKIFSINDAEIHISKPQKIRGLIIKGNRSFKLNPGENVISLNILLKSNYRSERGLLYLLIENHKLQIDSTLYVSSPEDDMEELILPSQNNIIKDVFYNFKRTQRSHELFYCGLFGEIGVGKSYIVKKLIDKFDFESKDVFFYSLSDNGKMNYRILIYLTFFLLFPYLPYNSLDMEYLKKLGDTVSFINPDFLQMISNERYISDTGDIIDIERFSSSMQTVISGNSILPANMCINSRIIILEDIHKLDTLGLSYLFELMDEINQRNLPVFLLFSSNPYIKERTVYQSCKSRFPVIEFKCDLNFEDVHSAASKVSDDKELGDYLSAFKSNVFEVFTFIRFLNHEDTDSEDSFPEKSNFFVTYNLFLRSRMLEKSILERFMTFFKMVPESKPFCDKIYWSATPVEISTIPENIADKLLSARLIRCDDDNYIKPYHDLYINYYRNQYSEALEKLSAIEPDGMEKYRLRINHSVNQIELKQICDYIQDLINSQRYYSVLYILEDVFRENNLESALTRMGESLYYSLYINYALAAHQQSISSDCEKTFKNIYAELCGSYEPSMILIAVKCQWELYMIQFENLQYKRAKKTRESILKLIQKLYKVDHKTENIEMNYYARRSCLQNILIDADLGNALSHDEFDTLYKELKTSKEPYLAESFRARYAVVISKNDPERCIELLNKGRTDIKSEYGTEDKHYQWCDFYYEFYSLIYYGDEGRFQYMLSAAETLRKNQAGNYRKKLFAIASLYYIRGLTTEGNKVLLKNEHYSTVLRKRYQGFYHETSAIHSIIAGKRNAAVGELDDAIKIFCGLSDYADIPTHNKKVIMNGDFSENRIRFLFGNNMESNVYYLDPRSAW